MSHNGDCPLNCRETSQLAQTAVGAAARDRAASCTSTATLTRVSLHFSNSNSNSNSNPIQFNLLIKFTTPLALCLTAASPVVRPPAQSSRCPLSSCSVTPLSQHITALCCCCCRLQLDALRVALPLSLSLTVTSISLFHFHFTFTAVRHSPRRSLHVTRHCPNWSHTFLEMRISSCMSMSGFRSAADSASSATVHRTPL